MSEEIRAIREDEYEACLDLWETVWKEEGRDYFARYFYGDPEFQNEYTRVCVVDERIVSAVQIVKRVVACGDLTLTMGGIGNVATLSEYRGRGYNTACLRQAIAIMEADALDFSLLGTDIFKYYERLGWEAIPTRFLSGEIREEGRFREAERRPGKREEGRVITDPGLPPELGGWGGQIRPYEARDDATIHALYAAFNRSRPFTVRRSAPYWRDWIGWWQGTAPGEARVAERDGVPLGYGLFEVGEHAAIVREIGAVDGDDDAIEALLYAMAEGSRDRGIRKMGLSLPTTAAIRRAAQAIFVEPTWRTGEGIMVRLLHRDNLLRGLAPELTDRWRRAGSPPGDLNFETPYGATRLEAHGDFLQIVSIDNDRPNLLFQSDLFALLAGRGLSPERLSEEESLFASALFPPFDSWFWEMDGF